MAVSPDKFFFAGSRGFFTDGDTFLDCIGLGSFNNQAFHVRETVLNKRGIKLGDFFSASVPLGKPIENFNKLNYKFTVKVDGNFATIEDQEADLEKNTNGFLIFKTKTFGSVASISQSISLGKYKINIRVTKSSEEHLFNNMKYCAEVKEAVTPSETSPVSSSKVIVGAGFATSGSNANSSSNVVVGAGFSVNNNKKKMKAFVHSVKQSGEFTTHYLWICDNHQKSIFSSKNHKLAVGHFFEGIFLETPTKMSKWQCLKYMNPIDALMQGAIYGTRIQLNATVERYQSGDGATNKYPQVYTEHLGLVIDNKDKLPADCTGRQILTQLLKVEDDYKWVVTKLI